MTSTRNIFCRFFFTFLYLVLPCLADLPNETVYLTWQQSPTTTMTIQWISLSDQTQNRIIYRKKDEVEWKAIAGNYYRFPQTLEYLIHRVELQSLKPGSEYIFRLNSDSQEYKFRTMPLQMDEGGVRFVVGGDMYHDGIDLVSATNRQAAKFNPSFAIAGGDIAYASSSIVSKPQNISRWIKWVKTWHKDMVTDSGNLIPVIAVVGNHDVSGNYNQTPAQARIFTLLFPMPGPQVFNALDFGSYLSLFLMDSGHANPIEGKQTEWLSETLQQRQKVTHRLAAYHVPAYSSVRSFNQRISVDIRRFWVPLFEKGGIQAVFEHHDHAYKRTYPLLNNQIHPSGIIYLGDGAWGIAKPRNVKARHRKRFYIAKFIPKRHFIGVVLQKDRQSFFSIDPQGLLLDELVKKLDIYPPKPMETNIHSTPPAYFSTL